MCASAPSIFASRAFRVLLIVGLLSLAAIAATAATNGTLRLGLGTPAAAAPTDPVVLSDGQFAASTLPLVTAPSSANSTTSVRMDDRAREAFGPHKPQQRVRRKRGCGGGVCGR